MNHKVSDFIIRLKNASLAKRRKVILPYSRIAKDIAKVLVKEGFLESVKETKDEEAKTIEVEIKYRKRMPILSGVLIVSKPSLRVYVKAGNIGKIERRSRNTLILSTNSGIMTGKEAYKKGVGGELLFEIW